MSEKQTRHTETDQTVNDTDAKLANNNKVKAAYTVPALRIYGSVSKLTLGGGGSLGDGATMDMVPSDPAIKENIVRVDTHPLGIGLYLFDYKPSHREQRGAGRQFGVMADEVAVVMPEAVSVHPDGYKMVNYAMLGISRRIQ